MSKLFQSLDRPDHSDDHILTEKLSEGMKKILQAELEAGNEIKDTHQGGFFFFLDDHIFVFLKYPFKGKYDISGTCYRVINDKHYWDAEYDDDVNHQTIASNY